MARPPVDMPETYNEEEPNHMIFWLDVNIGDPKEYIHLKEAFGSNTDPRCQTWTMLTDRDYDNLIAANSAVSVTFEGVNFLLQAFTNEKDCLQAFDENQDKRIFFITSGSMGRTAVPKIIEQYRNIFTDKIIDKSYQSVYVFCHDITLHMDWAMDYLGYIQMFNFDSELLERMTRDIAEYFIERGKRLRQGNDFKGALQRLEWAKKLWYQHEKMTQNFKTDAPQMVRQSEGSKNIDKLIAEIEVLILKDSPDENNDDNCRPSKQCG